MDFSLYLKLRVVYYSYSDWEKDFKEGNYLNFSLPFNKISIYRNYEIDETVEKEGIVGLFKNEFACEIPYGPRIDLEKIDTELKITNKFGDTFEFSIERQDLNLHYWSWFNLIKISKKTNKCIAVSYKAGKSFDIYEHFSCHLFRTNDFNGYVISHLDGNNKNLKTNNLIPLPKGYSLNQLMKETCLNKKYSIYSDYEYSIKQSKNWKELYQIMQGLDDKVWLNHNIVCIIMDRFMSSFFIPDFFGFNINQGCLDKENYIIIDMYAKKFGLYPTLDRIVLTYWKFLVRSYINKFSLSKPNIKYNVEVSGDDTSWSARLQL